ncbi:hypothetical protein [Spiroplasma endosymbiont of Polydrusus pterygomalis]|uniref:hypothetical protein n=1 Tax=Spiroplasma endosymbiont of Polydrusus pterygomalis TaxID=3139327 RepID=UPI003CCB4F39
MADLKLNNQIKNITYPFYLKGNDFKELSLKALPIKNWIDNHGKELAEFIYRHLNHYALNGYQDIHLKDIPSAISKIDFVFREPLELIKDFKDEVNRIRVNIINVLCKFKQQILSLVIIILTRDRICCLNLHNTNY